MGVATPVKPGRPKGAKNKRTKAVEAAIASAGITPLEFMLRVLQDDSAPLDDRKWAAQSAAPYVHAKLSSTESKVTGTVKISEIQNVIVDPKG